MISPHSTHSSQWLQQQTLPLQFPRLTHTHRTEIAVLGGGITGLSIALELLQRGHQVTVIEALAIGGGTTGASTGHLDAHPEQGAAKLLDAVGLEQAKEIVRRSKVLAPAAQLLLVSASQKMRSARSRPVW